MKPSNVNLIICGDCGGTNTRLALWEIPVGQQRLPGHKAPGKLLFSQNFINHECSSFTEICQKFLKASGHTSVTSCCLACAGPILNNTVKFTNIGEGWVIDGDRLSQDLNISRVLLINDFVAIGYGLLTLQNDDFLILNDVERDLTAPIATLGAGTGLGECFLTPSNGEYTCFGCEGGHTDFSPVNEIEIELLKYLKKKYNCENRISQERVISGIGLSDIYEFLTIKYPEKVTSKVHKEWLEAKSLRGGIVGKYSFGDELCSEAMKIFVSAYGREAGNVALKYLPRGGLFITGGMVPKNIDHFTLNSSFMNAFFDKGRVSNALKTVPVYLVIVDDVGERGVHVVAHRLALEEQEETCQNKSIMQYCSRFMQDVNPIRHLILNVAVVAAGIGYALAKRNTRRLNPTSLTESTARF